MSDPRWTASDDGKTIRFSNDLWLEWDDIHATATVLDSQRSGAFAALVDSVRLAERTRTAETERDAAMQAIAHKLPGWARHADLAVTSIVEDQTEYPLGWCIYDSSEAGPPLVEFPAGDREDAEFVLALIQYALSGEAEAIGEAIRRAREQQHD